MGVIKTHNILARQRRLALNANQFRRINMITVLRRVGARVAAPYHRLDRLVAGIVELAHQHAATLMRIGLFPVLAQLIEKPF